MSTSTPTPERAAVPPRHSTLFGVPNLLTFGRILVIPVVVGAFYIEGAVGVWLAFSLFAFAAVSDFFDGWLARRLGQQSELGRVLDPIADKLLVAALLVMLAVFERAAPAAVVAILCREFLVAGLREATASKITIPVSWLAKWKTAAQMAAIGVLLAAPAFAGPTAALLGSAGEALLWLAVALSWVTAIDYTRAALRHLLTPTDAGG